jgi:hypothetical protein
MKKVALILALFACLLITGAAFAQDTLDPTAEPNFGNFPISQGFFPDPFIITAASGGDVDVSSALSSDCAGFVTSQPDITIDYSGSGEGIRFFFVGNGDTTLIVADPSGDAVCNDDGTDATFDPVVDIVSPAEGTYSIWIGSYNQDESIPGYLMVTEYGDSYPTSILTDIAGFVTTLIELNDAEEPAAEPTPTEEPTSSPGK